MSKPVSNFSVFLETLGPQESPIQQRTRGATETVSAAERILETLRAQGELSPSALVDASGVDVIELGRALERLQSLGAVDLVGQPPNQRVRLGAKWEDVYALMK